MAKKKKQFAEPPEGWNFHPSGDMCMSCTKLLDNCSALPFSEMRAVMDTYEGNKVVKCTGYNHGDNDWSKHQKFKHSKMSTLGLHYSTMAST